MKLKREDGYWSLASSGLGDWLRGWTFPKKHKGGLLLVTFLVFFFGGVCFFAKFGIVSPETSLFIRLSLFFGFAIIVPGIIYGIIVKMLPPEVELPNAEFHTLGTCQNYGRRILDMVKELNVADHYIFLLNFYNLFYHDDHRLENPEQGDLNAIGRAVRVLPKRQRSTTWTRNPFQAVAGGLEAGKEAGEKVIVEGIAKKLGGLPEPAEAEAIITKEYLPDLLREFPRDVAMYIAVVLCSANNYTAIFPYDDRVVTKEEAVMVAANPTRENVVEYCSKFAGLQVEAPVTRRKGLMED